MDLRRHALMRALLGVHLAATVLGVAYAVAQWKGSIACGTECFRDPSPFRWTWSSTIGIFGPWGNPDFLSAGAAIGSLAGVGLAVSSRARWERVAALAGSAACVMGLWAAARNQGWLALFAGLVGVGLVYRDRLPRRISIPMAVSALTLAAVVLAAAWHPGTDRAPGVLAKLETRFRPTLDVRVGYWQATLRAFAERPLAGEGLDSFAETYARHRSAEDAARYGFGNITDKPHSVPLEWFQTAGVLGGVSFLVLAGGALVVAERARRRLAGPGAPVRRGILAGGVGMLLGYLAQSAVSIDVPPLWITFWWSLALIAAASRGSVGLRHAPPPPLHVWRQVALWVIGGAVVVGGWFTLYPLRADVAFRRATDAAQAGDGATADLAYRLALRYNPHEAFYRAARGQSRAFTALQRPQASALFVPLATEDYTTAARLEPGNLYYGRRAYQFFDGLAQIGLDPDNNRRAAEEWWQRTLANDPRDPDVLVDGGVLKLHAKDPAGAVARFEEALLLRPDSVQALKGLGGARVLLFDKAAAVESYSRALEIAPEDAEAQAGLRAAQALPEIASRRR